AWHPHLNRTLFATTSTESGEDRAWIGLRLGHHALSSTSSYVVLDPVRIPSLAPPADWADGCLTLSANALAFCLGWSLRHAARLRAATGGAVRAPLQSGLRRRVRTRGAVPQPLTRSASGAPPLYSPRHF